VRLRLQWICGPNPNVNQRAANVYAYTPTDEYSHEYPSYTDQCCYANRSSDAVCYNPARSWKRETLSMKGAIMKFVAAAAVIAALAFATPAQAQAATRCEVVEQYGGFEVQETGLEPYGVYFLYVKDGPGGFDPILMAMANGGGNIRILLGEPDHV
jgi:hypothetical protein